MKNILKKEIIYIVNYPLSELSFKREGIQNWINHGWHVKIFDITRLIYPKFWNNIKKDKFYVNFKRVTIFKNIKDILFIINNFQEKVLFVDNIGWSDHERKIRATARAHGLILSISAGTIPKPKNSKSYIKLLRLIIYNPLAFIGKLFGFYKTLVKNYYIKKNYSDFLVVSGRKSLLGVNKKKTKIIKAHNYDYDVFLQKSQIKSKKKSNSLVFLDENTPYYLRSGLKSYKSSKKYFKTINFGLSQIAKSLKLKIKIAVHPKSDHAVNLNKYKYPIFKNKTFELIRNADVVVAHSSTSVQWAIIMKKPILFLISEEIPNTKLIDSYASILGKKVINLDNISKIRDFNNYLHVDNVKYEKFIKDYIKLKGSPKKLSSDIIIEHLEKELLFK